MHTAGSVEKDISTVGEQYRTAREYDTWPHYNTQKSAGKFVSSLGRRHTTFQPVRINLFDTSEDENSEDTDYKEDIEKNKSCSNISSTISATLEYDFNQLKVSENERTAPCTNDDCSRTCDSDINHSVINSKKKIEESKLYSKLHTSLEQHNDDSEYSLLENADNSLRTFNLSLERKANNTHMPKEENDIHIQNSYVSEDFDNDKYLESDGFVFGQKCKRIQRYIVPENRITITAEHELDNKTSSYITNEENVTSNESGMEIDNDYCDISILDMRNLEKEFNFRMVYENCPLLVNSEITVQRHPFSDLKNINNIVLTESSNEEFLTSEIYSDLDNSDKSFSPCSTRDTLFIEKGFQATVELADKYVQVSDETECEEKEIQTDEVETSGEFVSPVENPFGTDTIIVNNKNYFVLNELGKGGSSVVYQVFDPINSCLFAVKCVSLPESDQIIATGFLNEVKLLKRLQGSDYVIQLYDYEHVDERNVLYVVMESGDTDFGKLTRSIFKTQNRLPINTVLFYWMQILRAVQYIHSAGIIHSDLKPANFLLISGRLKLIDFGIASSVQGDTTSILKDSAVGTFNYMSPEAIKDVHNNTNGAGKCQYKIRYRSDVWSLGCILYNLIYGRTPFQHIPNTLAKIAAITNPNTKINYPPCESCPKIILDTMKKCLMYDAAKRPTVTELLQTQYHREASNMFVHKKPESKIPFK